MNIKDVGLAVLAIAAMASLSGCSAMIEKATKNSEERARHFSDAELCQHVKDDTNEYYVAANNQEVAHRNLSCH